MGLFVIMHRNYVGRFAPSPSGQLHFGSLITAVASYLDAKRYDGKWLVRMEDIDEPRCIEGIDADILLSLEKHSLLWDDEVIYQSQQHSRYQAMLNELIVQQRAYFCTCTRKQIKSMGGRYSGVCRTKNLTIHTPDTAVRLKLDYALQGFEDLIMESVDVAPTDTSAEDVVLKRRDGLFSYNLVVVLDDVFQNVTHVIRGCDLIDVTPLHQAVFRALKFSPLQYGHVPVAAIAPGRKLSKQNRATPINNETPKENLVKALRFLGFSFPNAAEFDSTSELLQHAVSVWDRKKVVKMPEIIVPQHESTYYSEPL
jgi:glutamyl-Q tRNA(Asp) synthetase